MSRYKLNVILSQAAGKHPAKRSLEESVAAALIMEPGLEVSIIPNLYDLAPDHTGRMFLNNVAGDMVVLTWLYSRAAFWLLDRDGVKGQFGESLLKPADDDDEDDTPHETKEEVKGIGALGVIPDRHIYCLDLRDANSPDAFIKEIKRIYAECQSRRELRQMATAKPSFVQLGFISPLAPVESAPVEPIAPAFTPEQLLIAPGRRWFPVIDYSRCTNCLECLDFCLFGVYGVDKQDTIFVDHQDNCKKGCPACSRVCPQQAIIFPEYKSPAIAGAPGGEVGGLKIDLTRLFGGESKDALSQAVAERDRELMADGREAVGVTVGLAKRQPVGATQAADDLDRLMNDLDALGL